jgi:hypothetical protein
MLKRNGQHKQQTGEAPLRHMTDSEYAAYFEAFGAIKSAYQTLCLISDKLREVETTAARPGLIEDQMVGENVELLETPHHQSPWQICTHLMRLDQNEVLLCQRMAEHGVEYAVMDRLPATSEFAKANGPVDLLQTGNDPYRVLRTYLQAERQALELMVNEITAQVRLLVAERFPEQELNRVVNSITRMCKNVARLGFSETHSEAPVQTHTRSHGVRIY